MAITTWESDSPYINVTQAFGNTQPDGKAHRGVDWNTRGPTAGSPMHTMVVRALQNGEVLRSEYGTGGNASWGNFVAIYYPSLGVTVLTAHFDTRTVSVGDSVSAGTPIGVMGTTGNVTGPHVHEETHRGRGITNVLINPVSGIPNTVGTYENTYPGDTPGPGPDPGPEPGEWPEGKLPADKLPMPIPAENIPWNANPYVNPNGKPSYFNIVVMEDRTNGEFSHCPACDYRGYVYWFCGRFLRYKTDKSEPIQQWEPKIPYWSDVTDVRVTEVQTKKVTYLPDW